MHEQIARDLLDFIQASPTCYQVIENFKTLLTGYQPLSETELWTLEPGKGYYVVRNDASLITFRLPKGELKGFRMAAAHSDSPLFKVKPKEEMTLEGHYVKLNVEKYGGMIYGPWMDRPLSIAGRAVVRQGDDVAVKLVNFDRDLVLIPNLAIHMNREVNSGMAYNPQVDLLPLFGDGESKGMFLPMLAEQVGVAPEDILGTDLFLYNRMKGTIWGAHNEFISSRSLDDLQCAWSLMQGYLQSEPDPEYGALCCIFDAEEVGSGGMQGADSTFFSDVLERIGECLGLSAQQRQAVIARSFLVSADNAHAVHPNHPEKADPTNRPYLNEGIVIKYNAGKKYTTDGISEARFKLVCEKAGVPYQTFTNRSDMLGGSTLGRISISHVSLSTVDIGLPQLAMHSPYETAGVRDTEYLVRAMRTYFGN